MGPNGQIPAQYRVGVVLSGVVREVAPFGIFVELEPGVIATCTLPHLKRPGRGVLPPEVYSPGEQVELRLYVVDREAGVIGGSEIAFAMPDEEFSERYHGKME
jgi:ribosomal protein S1